MKEEKPDLNRIKLENEIINLKWSKFIDIGKISLPFVMGIIVFLAINVPETIVNKSLSKESINRERAKLVLDLLKKENNNDILIGLDIIEVSYPDDENWIKGIKKIFQLRKEKQDFDSLARGKLDSSGLAKLKNLNDLYGIKESKVQYWTFRDENNSNLKLAGTIDSIFGNTRMASQIKEEDIDKEIVSEKNEILKLFDSLNFSGMPNPKHEEH